MQRPVLQIHPRLDRMQRLVQQIHRRLHRMYRPVQQIYPRLDRMQRPVQQMHLGWIGCTARCCNNTTSAQRPRLDTDRDPRPPRRGATAHFCAAEKNDVGLKISEPLEPGPYTGRVEGMIKHQGRRPNSGEVTAILLGLRKERCASHGPPWRRQCQKA
jgi:hypothetical protein